MAELSADEVQYLRDVKTGPGWSVVKKVIDYHSQQLVSRLLTSGEPAKYNELRGRWAGLNLVDQLVERYSAKVPERVAERDIEEEFFGNKIDGY